MVMVHSCVAVVGRGRLASAANALSVASDPTQQLPPALPSPVLCDEGPRAMCMLIFYTCKQWEIPYGE